MPTFSLDPFLTELKGYLSATVWPEITKVYDAERVTRIPWKDIELPSAVIITNKLIGVRGEYGTNRLTFRIPADIYYVDHTLGNADTLRGKLEDLVNALWATNVLTEARPEDCLGMEWSDDLPANQILVSADRPQRAGMATIPFLISKGRM